MISHKLINLIPPKPDLTTEYYECILGFECDEKTDLPKHFIDLVISDMWFRMWKTIFDKWSIGISTKFYNSPTYSVIKFPTGTNKKILIPLKKVSSSAIIHCRQYWSGYRNKWISYHNNSNPNPIPTGFELVLNISLRVGYNKKIDTLVWRSPTVTLKKEYTYC